MSPTTGKNLILMSINTMNSTEAGVIHPDKEWVFGTLQQLSPLFKCQLHRQQLPVTNVIIPQLGKVDVRSKHKDEVCHSFLCDKTAPTQMSEVSTTTKDNSRSGRVRMGAEVKCCLNRFKCVISPFGTLK